MGTSTVITWMIIICVIFIGLIVFSKPIKYILRFAVQAVGGMALAFIFNLLFSPLGLAIGLNYLNFFIVGLLGLPGFVSLYIISWIV